MGTGLLYPFLSSGPMHPPPGVEIVGLEDASSGKCPFKIMPLLEGVVNGWLAQEYQRLGAPRFSLGKL